MRQAMPEGRPHILAVDDEPRSAELLVRALRGLGHVDTATTGEEGWERFCGKTYDLVITDQRMPGLTGAELLARVAERDEHAGRVLLTGYADMEATVAAINEGRLHAYVTKPWRPDHLQLTAKNLLERTRLARRNQLLVTELRGRNSQLEMALADLRKAQHDLVAAESLSAVGRMVEMVVHDLRGPLGVIRSAASLLRSPGASLSAAERDELVGHVDTETDRLVRMCSELLELGRPSAAEGEREDLALDDLLRDVIEAIAEPAGHAGVQVSSRLESDGRVLADSERLRRLFLNLAHNAVQAMPDGGRLRIESARAGSFGTVRVIDSGVGVPEAIRDTLFDPFVTHGRERGSGLGLAIARRVAEEHDGELELSKSGPGGTTFEVRVPLRR